MSDKQATRAELLARRLARCAWGLEDVTTLTEIDASMICDAMIYTTSKEHAHMSKALALELKKAHCEAYPVDCGAVDPLND